MALVLLVDDDDAVRRVVAKALIQWGHSVLEADNGVSALRLVDAHTLGLIVTDLLMPRMDGFALMAALDQRGVASPVVVKSAYADTSGVPTTRLHNAVAFLPKPFDLHQLAEVVGQLLPNEPPPVHHDHQPLRRDQDNVGLRGAP